MDAFSPLQPALGECVELQKHYDRMRERLVLSLGIPPHLLVSKHKEPIQMMTLRKRRQLGLTIGNILNILRSKDKAELEGPVDLLAIDVLAELVKSNPKGWDNIDWDAVYEFVLKIIELILKILPFLL